MSTPYLFPRGNTQNPHAVDALIIGGGITGLSAAYRLHERGKSFALIEAKSRLGGPMESIRSGGYLFETGPNTIQIDGLDLIRFFETLGLEAHICDANSSAARRYVVKDGKPIALPTGPLSLLANRLLSPLAKLRLLREPMVAPLSPEQDESIAQLIERRLGRQVLDRMVNPFIAGIYAGSPDDISVRYGFPKLKAMESEHGSLIRAAIQMRRAQRQAGDRFKSRLISFSDGLEMLPLAIADHLPASAIHCDAVIGNIGREADGLWHVELVKGKRLAARDLIVTAPMDALLQMPFPLELKQQLKPLTTVPHPPVTCLQLGFSEGAFSHPLDGFGILIPECEQGFSILGALFSSTLFPNRAPQGHSALTVFVGGSRQPALTQLDDTQLLKRVLADLEKLLGLSAHPHFFHRVDWPRAIPQYTSDFGEVLKAFDQVESKWPHLTFRGHIRDGISLPKCIRAGLAAGDAL